MTQLYTRFWLTARQWICSIGSEWS